MCAPVDYLALISRYLHLCVPLIQLYECSPNKLGLADNLALLAKQSNSYVKALSPILLDVQ